MTSDAPLPPFNASDPQATFLAASCLDLLLIELVPMAYRLAAELSLDDRAPKAALTQSLSPPPPPHAGEGELPPAGSTKLDDEEQREAVFYRLEMLGYRVGLGMAERFSRDRPRFTDTLDVIKFLCKDLWTLVFRKQIDNLKTNHRGVYVLTDNTFRPFARMSAEAGGQAVLRAQPVRNYTFEIPQSLYDWFLTSRKYSWYVLS
ncbi:MAG: Trafficking protein particle complex subunit 33 [Trizodia sp. TS-e1964]|nr:MAG: Trafficking protein particle complex subunit 33 [Trizodia sp. TS-e1964]